MSPKTSSALPIRFIHSADWQLGMTRHFLNAEAQGRFSQARIDVIKEIGRVAASERVEFVVVSGDVFETNQVGPQTIRRALAAMGEILVPVFLLPGNHDPLDPGSIFTSAAFIEACPANVRVIKDTTPFEVRPGVQVLGAPWKSKRPTMDLVGACLASLTTESQIVRVMVGHGSVDNLMDLGNLALIRRATVETALADGRIAYLALGDRHSTTRVGETERIWYAGAPEPTDYDELDPGNILVVELTENGQCLVTPHHVGTWRFYREQFELDESHGLEELRGWLDQQPDRERAIVKLTLIGTVSLSTKARLDDLLEWARDLYGAVEEWERHQDLVVRPNDDDFADLGLSGFAQVTLDRLRAEAILDVGRPEVDPQAEAARDALALLVRLATGKATSQGPDTRGPRR